MTLVLRPGMVKQIVTLTTPLSETTTVKTSYGSSPSYTTKVGDTNGSFQEGVYRVTPYEVSKEETLMGPGRLFGAFSFAGNHYSQEVIWDHHYAWAGSLLTDLRSRYTSEVAGRRNYSLAKAYGKVASAVMEQGENIGEIRETLATIMHPLKNLREFLWRFGDADLTKLLALRNLSKQYQKGRITREALDTAASTWLEYRYGLTPIYNMIVDIADALEKQKKKVDFDRIYSVGSLKTYVDEGKFTRALGSIPGTNFSAVNAECLVRNVHQVNASVQFKFVRPLSNMENWGLSLPFLPATLWNLTRMSFVVDWFFSVGAWLESWRYNPAVTILGDTSGYKRTVEVTSCLLDATQYTQKVRTLTPCPMKIESFKRTVNNGRPIVPVFRALDGLDTNKLVDAISLAYGFLTSRRPPIND